MSNHPLHTVIIFILFAGLGLFFHYDKKKDLFDESAKESLRRTDSICLKIVFIVGILIIFCQFLASAFNFQFYLNETSAPIFSLLDLSGVILGYGVVFMILFLTIFRAVIFSIIDRRGI
jgi:sterol desaturase/sphingolipid hydroxylase (fatty acid hydroxylase superfamily)